MNDENSYSQRAAMLCQGGRVVEMKVSPLASPPGPPLITCQMKKGKPRTEMPSLFGVLLVATLSKLQSQNASLALPHRFVITRPSNECHLLPSDLVFCAIPFSTTCNKSESTSSTQIQDTTNVTPLTQGLSFFDAHNIQDP